VEEWRVRFLRAGSIEATLGQRDGLFQDTLKKLLHRVSTAASLIFLTLKLSPLPYLLKSIKFRGVSL
jgi:hypothetical protein